MPIRNGRVSREQAADIVPAKNCDSEGAGFRVLVGYGSGLLFDRDILQPSSGDDVLRQAWLEVFRLFHFGCQVGQWQNGIRPDAFTLDPHPLSLSLSADIDATLSLTGAPNPLDVWVFPFLSPEIGA
jgi:hypothetical protein